MTFSRRTLSVLTVLIVTGVLGGATWWRLKPAEDAEAEASEVADGELPSAANQQFSADAPQPVSGAVVVQDTLWVSVTAAAQAEAIARTVLKSQVDGVVQSLPVRENGRVSAGDVVLQLDTLELALAVSQARADLAGAQRDFQSRLLGDDETVDPEVRRQREIAARAISGLDAAEVRLQQEQLRLQRATVRAPFEGRVADLLVVAGQHVTAGTDLMTIVDLDPIKVEAEVLEAELGLLQEGRRAKVTFAAFPGESFSGRVETINPVVDPEQRTGRVTVHLPNAGHRIKPGMYANVQLDAQYFPDRILVPRAAILERGGRNMLFVYEGDERRGAAKWRYVATGHENEQLVEIVESDEDMVAPGEVVLVSGHHYLAHDTPVRLVDNVAAEGGRPSR